MSTSESSAQCPWPFLPVSLGADFTESLVHRSVCRDGCCLPCPYGRTLFPTLFSLFNAFDIIEIISLVTLIVLVLSFAILPRGRQLTTPVASAQLIGLMFIQGGGVYLVGQDPARTLCANPITLATQYTNARCAAQGVFTIFGTFTSALTMFSRLLQLHLQVVWAHNPATFKSLTAKVTAMIVLPYLISLIFALAALFRGDIRYSVAHRCGPSPETAAAYMYWPMCIIGLMCFTTHFWTCYKIIKVYETHRRNLRIKGPYILEDTDTDDSFLSRDHSFSVGTKLTEMNKPSACKAASDGFTPGPSSEGFWKMPGSPVLRGGREVRDDTVPLDDTQSRSALTFELPTDNKRTKLPQIDEDEIEQLDVTQPVPGPYNQLTPQQLRQQREILTRIRPVRTSEEKRNSTIIKLWRLNWRSAKLTLVGASVLWLYAICSLSALAEGHYVQHHPAQVTEWTECVAQYNPVKCEHLATRMQKIWRQLMIDCVRAFLGLSIAVNEISRAQYLDQVREMWRWRKS